MTKNFSVLHIDAVVLDILVSFFRSIDSLEQEINPDTERPLVVHHQTNQITYVREGSGQAVVSEKKFNIKRGDLLIIPQGNPHSFLSEDSMTLLHYHWPKEALEADRCVLQEYYSGWQRLIPGEFS